MTCPGVPDIYQGTELWDFSLVDPDNRRPVDFGRRRELLAGLKEAMALAATTCRRFCTSLLDHFEDGRVKMYLTWRLLSFRRERAKLFQEADYQPLESIGMKKAHVVGVRRGFENEVIWRWCRGWWWGWAAPGYWPMGEQVWGDTWVLLPEEEPRPDIATC